MLGRGSGAHRMECHEMPVPHRCANALGHGMNHFKVAPRHQRSVAAQNPDDIALVRIPGADPLAVYAAVSLIKDFRTFSPRLIVFISPCWKQTDVNTELRSSVDNPIDMVPVSVRTVVRNVWQRWIELA